MKKKLIFLILAYFRFLAKLQLAKNKPLIIGVTGTAGKTSTRNAIYAVLKDKYQVKVSFKANSETGIPLNILGLKPKNYSPLDWLRLIINAPLQLLTNWEKYNIYLAEMAIDSPHPPKNMAYLLTIIKPKIGIFLNTHLVHGFAFDQLVKEKNPHKRKLAIKKLIAQEKGKLIKQLPKDGLAVLNIDDHLVKKFITKTKAKKLNFGQSKSADLKILNANQNLKGTSFKYQYHRQIASLNLKKFLLPSHFAYSFAAAIAVGLELGLDLKLSCQLIEKNFKLAPGRASLIAGINQSLIFDSSYNAPSNAVIENLSMLSKLKKNKLIALLGDMREMGQQSEQEHQRVAQALLTTADKIVLVGPEMKKYALPILEKNKKNAAWFKTAFQAADYLKDKLKKDNLLLVKGSQNTILLEAAVEQLMAEPHKAEALLCRRGKFWNKKRAELKN